MAPPKFTQGLSLELLGNGMTASRNRARGKKRRGRDINRILQIWGTRYEGGTPMHMHKEETEGEKGNG